MADEIDTILHLGTARFDPGKGALTDANGQGIRLRPQSLQVLAELAQSPGELVGREELIERVWTGVSVTDDSLIQCIADIRRAIGDKAHNVVRTVPKKGYQLVPGSPDPPAAGNSPVRFRALIFVGIAVLVAALAGWWQVKRPQADTGRPSLAILPFTNATDDIGQINFADALTQAITTNVSKFDGLFVVSGYSAQQYRDKDTPLTQIAQALSVRYVFKGEVLPDPGRLTVNAQLVDGHTGQAVWAERFKVPKSDVFVVQETLSAKIATSLVSQVEIATERQSWQRDRTNLNAYELLLRADLPKIERAALNQSIALLQNAVELDPNYARAYALMGGDYLMLWRHSLAQDPGDALAQARKWTAYALSLDDRNYEALKTLATIQLYADEDHEAAYASLSRALEINPNHADLMVQMATLLAFMDRYEEANRWLDKAYRQNPLYPVWYDWNGSFVYVLSGQYERGVTAAKNALAVYQTSASIRRILIYGYGMLGQWDQARGYADQILARTPDFRLATHMRNAPYQNPDKKAEVFAVMERAGLPP